MKEEREGGVDGWTDGRLDHKVNTEIFQILETLFPKSLKISVNTSLAKSISFSS